MSIYTQFVTPSQLISPVNGYTCRRITKQNIKQFGFDSVEELHQQFPDFPLRCYDYYLKKSISISKAAKKQNARLKESREKEKIIQEIEYNKSPKLCLKCKAPIDFRIKNNKFCSRRCANSRGPRTDEFKVKVSKKLKGKKHSNERKRNISLAKGRIPLEDRPNTVCVICNNDTGTKNRKTCSDRCYSSLMRRKSKNHPKCGGQKHTHRSKIYNRNGEVFFSESSYEVKVSRILNSLNIEWTRPSFVWYTDEKEEKRRYYPDFYLPEYDLYLDPKNDYLIKTDIDKIYRASNENNITVAILGKDSINKDTINNLVGDRGNAPLSHGCKPCVLLLN